MARRVRWTALGVMALMCTVLGGTLHRSAAMDMQPADGSLPFHLSVGALSRDGYAPSISMSSASAFQGGAVKVSVDRATAGSVHVFGRDYVLSSDGDSLAGFVGFGTEDPPGPTTLVIDVVDLGGEASQHTRSLTVKATDWTVDYITIPPPDPNAPPPPPGLIDEQPRLNELYAGVSPRRWLDDWHAPLPEPLHVSGYFGEQRSFNGGPVQGHHGGTDLAADAGTPVFATNDGIVVLAERVLTRGNLVVIDHGGGIFSSYGHQEKLNVTVGDVVARGQIIGWVGTTGLSTGPHLHWEMSVAGVLVDGLRWLDGTQGF